MRGGTEPVEAQMTCRHGACRDAAANAAGSRRRTARYGVLRLLVKEGNVVMSNGHAAQCNDSTPKGKRNGPKLEQKVHIRSS